MQLKFLYPRRTRFAPLSKKLIVSNQINPFLNPVKIQCAENQKHHRQNSSQSHYLSICGKLWLVA